MPDIKAPAEFRQFPVAIIQNMVVLATSGFGLVVALAWNELIKRSIDTYIAPYFAGSDILSLFIYALVITVIAVVVVMQLSSLQRKLEDIEASIATKRKKQSQQKRRLR